MKSCCSVVLFALLIAGIVAQTPMSIYVNAGLGKDSTVSLGSGNKQVVMHANNNKFSITSNGKDVLSMTPLSKDSAAFTPEVLGGFVINSLVAQSIYSDDFEIVNPDAPFQQWLVVDDDTFINGTDGWSAQTGPELTTSRCGGLTVLGGACQTSSQTVSKTYNLPKHAQVQVTARFHFIDNWDDDTAWMKLSTANGDSVMWTEQYTWCSQFFTMMCPKGNSACGKEEYPDKLSRLVSVSMDHSDPTLTVSFGTNIPDIVPACEVSYGISSVVIEVR
eukprot:c30798_g1_i1.p1 GENE.c30798_g1_i1~~c30798_g1_i1.p1  ORF type:complete len:276 (-),score=103.53 c30798_g1_i1:45-872(-)